MAEQGREAEAEEGSRQEEGDKEAEPRTFEGCPICPLVDRAGPGEKGKVKTVHSCRSFVFLTSC